MQKHGGMKGRGLFKEYPIAKNESQDLVYP